MNHQLILAFMILWTMWRLSQLNDLLYSIYVVLEK
jgi:hypothetical protein